MAWIVNRACPPGPAAPRSRAGEARRRWIGTAAGLLVPWRGRLFSTTEAQRDTEGTEEGGMEVVPSWRLQNLRCPAGSLLCALCFLCGSAKIWHDLPAKLTGTMERTHKIGIIKHIKSVQAIIRAVQGSIRSVQFKGKSI